MHFGADEAGRGPVLGSMFAAAVSVPDESDLPAGIRDSKFLTPGRREELDEALRASPKVSIGLAEVRVDEIDDPETDLNTLTVRAQAQALRQILEDDMEGIVDACDTDEARFARRVAGKLDKNVTLRAEHNADENHPVVGAASIVAKVARDAHVATLAAEYGEVGSGYPSDPTTKSFLEGYVAQHGELPACARASWQTSKDVLAAREQSGLTEF
ncbi:ribonuclease HII [Haladaptatus sp. GCM10025707]|uniref:ribonuclease HII n=1 Tax=unclassified Haladaptatus TaxID=2622732 RepID=UPI0023E7E27D|nr:MULTISPECIES: ribonuclease HII [unclassified Haladaptatus]